MKSTDLRTKSKAELQGFITEKRTELSESLRSLRSGELTNPNSISKIRRDIARAHTVVQEQASATEEEESK